MTPPFLTLALDVGEWLPPCCRCFNPCTLWIKCWIDTAANSDMVLNRKKIPALRNQILVIHSAVSHYID
jgi:hypothetical protein